MTPGPGGQFDHLLKNMKSRVKSQGSGVEAEESRVDIAEPEVKPTGEAKEESRVKSIESIVESQESGADTKKSRVETEEPRVISIDQQSDVKKVDSREKSLESRVDSLDIKALEEAVKEAITKPKLGVYSPLAAAMLRYKAITTPRYSMGSEMKEIIEHALKETYPELYEEVQKRMSD
jgi:hypothetical protein